MKGNRNASVSQTPMKPETNKKGEREIDALIDALVGRAHQEVIEKLIA